MWDRKWGLWFWDHFTHVFADGGVREKIAVVFEDRSFHRCL
jgi:hypothetical protein